MEKVILAAVHVYGSRSKASFELGISRSIIDRVCNGGPYALVHTGPDPLTPGEVEQITLWRIGKTPWSEIAATIGRTQTYLKDAWVRYRTAWVDPRWHKGALSQPVIDFHRARDAAAQLSKEAKELRPKGNDEAYVRALLMAGGFPICREPPKSFVQSVINARRYVGGAA
jgi:hypothetical protein